MHALVTLTQILGHGGIQTTPAVVRRVQKGVRTTKLCVGFQSGIREAQRSAGIFFFFNPASFFLFTDTFAATHVHTTFAHEGEAMKPYSTRTMADLCLCCVNLLDK